MSNKDKKEVMSVGNINNVVTRSVESINALLNGISNAVAKIENEVVDNTIRITNLEQNEEITTEQEKTIKRVANYRVREILGTDDEVWCKYHMIFYRRIYKDAKKYAGLGSSIGKTPKRNYQNVVDFMEAWNPAGGSAKLKSEADTLAYWRVRAREDGYLPPLKRK